MTKDYITASGFLYTLVENVEGLELIEHVISKLSDKEKKSFERKHHVRLKQLRKMKKKS